MAFLLNISSARCIWQTWTICPNTMARSPRGAGPNAATSVASGSCRL